MGTTFDAYVGSRRDLAFFAYCYIEGIPYVFGNVAQPAAWTGQLGDYTWDKSLTFFRSTADGSGIEGSSIDVVSQELDPEAGIMASGDMTLEFQIDPESGSGTWADLMLPAESARSVWYVDDAETVKPSRDYVKMLDTTGITVARNYWLGLECVLPYRIDTTAKALLFSNGVGRGRYGSRRGWYGRKAESDVMIGGPQELTTWPDVWKGRIVEVWLAACTAGPDGVLRPIDTAPRGSGSKQVFRGPIYSQEWGDGYASVRFVCQSLIQALEATPVVKPYVYAPGPTQRPDAGSGYFCVETNGLRYMEYDLGTQADAYGGVFDLINHGGFNDGDVIDAGTAATAFIRGIVTATGGDYGTLRVADQVAEGEEGAWKHYQSVIIASMPGGGALSDYMSLRVNSGQYPQQSAWPALGFTKDPAPQLANVQFRADTPIPDYTLGPTSGRLYYRAGADAVAYNDPPRDNGTGRLNGAVDACYVKLGTSHVAEVSFKDAAGTVYADAYGQYAVVRRNAGVGQTTGGGYWSVPQGGATAEDSQITVGMCWDFSPLMDVIRWLACGSGDHNWPRSGWNVLPDGYSLGLSPEWFDHEAFDEVQARVNPVSMGWWMGEPWSLRDLCKAVAAAYGLQFLPRITDAGYVISVTEIAAPPRDWAPSLTIDADWTASTVDPPTAELNDRNIVNVIGFRYGWDPIEGEYVNDAENKAVDRASVAKYGKSKELSIDLPWIPANDAGFAYQILAPLAMRLFSTYARPLALFNVPCFNPGVWAVELGDTVGLTHSYLPNYSAGGLGLTAEPMQVLGVDYSFGPGAQSWGRLKLIWRNAHRYRFDRYVPCLRLTSLVSGSTYTVAEDRGGVGFAGVDDPVEDVGHYTGAGTGSWKVRCYLPYADDSANYQTRTVTGIDTTARTITLSSALTGDLAAAVGDVVIEFREFDVTGGLAGAQEGFVFMADETSNLLTRADATTRAGSRWY